MNHPEKNLAWAQRCDEEADRIEWCKKREAEGLRAWAKQLRAITPDSMKVQ